LAPRRRAMDTAQQQGAHTHNPNNEPLACLSSTMADEKNADRSSIEIKTLLRKLHPDRGSHRDRVRALTKFRSYVLGGGVRGRCCGSVCWARGSFDGH
jgi:hypothetical protein